MSIMTFDLIIFHLLALTDVRPDDQSTWTIFDHKINDLLERGTQFTSSPVELLQQQPGVDKGLYIPSQYIMSSRTPQLQQEIFIKVIVSSHKCTLERWGTPWSRISLLVLALQVANVEGFH
jgi:hypothetical protein